MNITKHNHIQNKTIFSLYFFGASIVFLSFLLVTVSCCCKKKLNKKKYPPLLKKTQSLPILVNERIEEAEQQLKNQEVNETQEENLYPTLN